MYITIWKPQILLRSNLIAIPTPYNPAEIDLIAEQSINCTLLYATPIIAGKYSSYEFE